MAKKPPEAATQPPPAAPTAPAAATQPPAAAPTAPAAATTQVDADLRRRLVEAEAAAAQSAIAAEALQAKVDQLTTDQQSLLDDNEQLTDQLGRSLPMPEIEEYPAWYYAHDQARGGAVSQQVDSEEALVELRAQNRSVKWFDSPEKVPAPQE